METEKETIKYLHDILVDLVKFVQRIHAINKSWVGIDRRSEMLIVRARERLPPMQLLIEDVYFDLTKEFETNRNNIIDEKRELYKKAEKTWGKESQFVIAIEEMSELSTKLCHLLRGRKEKDDDDDFRVKHEIAEEIADVEIMLEQLKMTLNIELYVHDFKFCKLERLRERLEKEDSMIEIIDQIDNTIKKVSDSLEVVVDPAGISIFLEEYQIEGKKLVGIIHKKDGTTLFCYENFKGGN